MTLLTKERSLLVCSIILLPDAAFSPAMNVDHVPSCHFLLVNSTLLRFMWIRQSGNYSTG
ncbi:hypothetical protein G3O01_39125 [Burkholderia sp. Ac-20365]|nr:hypothetical protein [Burkholderia sp. Ac-20365]